MSSQSAVHVVLAGGGTAGHVNPLLSVAAAIKAERPRARVSVIGTAVGLEQHLVPEAGLDLDAIDKLPFPRKPNMQALRFPGRWRRQVRRTRTILQTRQADVVVGFGGYASAPAYRAAHQMGLPIALHEQNARAGMANKLGACWADYIGTAYDCTGLKPRRGARIERVGLPLRPAIASLCEQVERSREQARRQAAASLGLDPERPVLVVTGGSLGALSLNRAVSAAAPALLRTAQVVHLTGKGKAEAVQESVAKLAGDEAVNDLDPSHAGRGDYHVAAYLERIDLAFACADLILCRSGAGTVSELTALGLPAVYVPLPVGNGEQRFNAQPVVQAGGGLLVEDHELTSDWVSRELPPLLANQPRLQEMGRSAWSYGIRDAAQAMAHRVLDLADAHG
ncbi:UDP-N-acetylglucosamine--N-acetylmuramyl- (pentapeptide) pyrophosphoryl-undecaprenol N-acetylglucosamine transferase [Bifidobacterium actinocoloniiforme DSM 22766]|uniref:UDP-N-acetylglucosamine--N-acetylmuramyl-(pentapeptide) pyrophosphoryl-undecaprenol N-acetylglucosamine transferase n=1 Tax=Bifidobacterium actinocoloniiforme DSM 22766 TaxID=1437605 RepID=A0A086YZS2_9BIFI|nr:UDP-N-acetylglucosamine--N-acetylmuramyl-(pentapeptide) pyrophosphoryl-undecaprenol N-acetylglucosamine transferase [Bifidobacterium actinocoloniiforme]AKV55067.1 UDP-diphospho-muramoylpentapeptide beta-N-acetylglucosaminyltransferase [Bifidobacterium actinocoloniiforme DSM 22766]KFI39772.1 UDP-N-acetylglucosamine--N-acetylmuramyl- (pentapeptide) pyrophosphoryl-undecaprenol N-acetylglucosamine transferase [Bifidobacterium actinocoloniiforme DSM 22766]